MPNINLRLTDEEHAELREWARVGQRSIQREIVWRLFTVEGGQEPKYAPALRDGAGQPIEVPPDGTVASIPRKRMYPCKHHVPPTRVCQTCDL